MWILLFVFIFVLAFLASYRLNYKNYSISILKSFKSDKSALFMSLGTKIGVGSLIGTISSIIIGGYSSIIWMLIFSVITSSLIYYEAYLGKKYSINNKSGPYYIIKYGLKNNSLAILSTILLIITYSFLFQMIQSNTISNLLFLNYSVNKNIITISFILLLIITFSFSIKDIIHTMNKIVPIMCILFLVISIYGIISNIELLVINIKNINIFSLKSILTGMVIGIKRSIFINETLIGTTSISSGIDSNNIETSCSIQVLGSYFISFIITIILSLLLIIYNNNILDYNLLLSNMYYSITGGIGLFIIIIVIILFGLTTLLSGYYIGISNIANVTKCKQSKVLFDIIFTISILSGVYIKNTLIWKYLDILMFIMIIINSYSIIKLLGSEKNDRQ